MTRARSRLAWASAAALSLTLTASAGSAWAADTNEKLEAAERALANLGYKDAVKGAEAVLKQGGLPHAELLRAYRTLALSQAALGHEEKAREAFVLLLLCDPDTKGDPNLGPKLEQPLLAARGFWRQEPSRPGVEAQVAVLRRGDTGLLRVTTRDPTHAVSTVTVGFRWGNGAEQKFETKTVPVGEQSVPLPPPPETSTRLEYYVQAVDARDDVVFEAGSPDSTRIALLPLAPPPPPPPPPPPSKSVLATPAFWIAAGAVVVGGAVTGVYFATRHTDTPSLPPSSASFGPSLFCGMQACR